MKNDPDLLAQAKLGFIGELEPEGMFSSPMWLAHRAGAAMAREGGDEPAKVAMSRGYNVRIGTALGHEFIVQISGAYLERAKVVPA